MKNKVIINAAIASPASWYHRGQQRLQQSLDEQGEEHHSDRHFVSRLNSVSGDPYNDKVMTVKEAAGQGYKRLLWLDCSIKAVRPLQDIWDYIETNGYYLYQSGYNCAQTANDRCLAAYGLSRDEAEKIYECASNVVGLNLEHPVGKKLYEGWMKSLESKANFGIKWPTEEQRKKESMDPRFQFHRQDQTTLSISAGLLGLHKEREGHFVCRMENKDVNMNENIIFTLKGGE